MGGEGYRILGMRLSEFIPCAPEWTAVIRDEDDASVFYEYAVAFWQYLPHGAIRGFCPNYGKKGGEFIGPETANFVNFTLT
jgi:hypothetical protein